MYTGIMKRKMELQGRRKEEIGGVDSFIIRRNYTEVEVGTLQVN